MDTPDSWRWALVAVFMLVALVAAAEDCPELELLEYLADWQDEDGGMLEPRMFDDDGSVESEQNTGQTDAPE